MMGQVPVPPSAQQTSVQQQQQQQQQQQTQKFQAAYYAANPASEYAAAQQAALMNAMVEKYQYQQQTATAPPQYLPPQQPQTLYMPTQAQPTQQQQQQILNYVSAIQPQGPPAATSFPQYTNYQNYNIQAPGTSAVPVQQAPPQPAPPVQNQPAQPIYQTQSGLTYYPNTAQLPPVHQQRIIQPQRRPNPIPILAPPDHKKIQGSTTSNDDGDKNMESDKGASAENIDHILDNMFVQRRQTHEPTISMKESPALSVNDDKNDLINDGVKVM
jgi:hypothetical protein